MPIIDIDHVQIAIPAGGEDMARRFYGGVLGLVEIEKPDNLKKRGGLWFRTGSRQLHLGVDADFRPARKAHPAFHVIGLVAFAEQCRASGLKPVEDEPLPGYDRFYLDDPFGNRLEFLEPAA